jgi:hypothetical protein
MKELARMKPPKSHRETYTRDGVEYELDIEEDLGAFWGSWKCLDCAKNGPSSPKCGSYQEALTAAKNSLGPHHEVKHGLRAKP